MICWSETAIISSYVFSETTLKVEKEKKNESMFKAQIWYELQAEGS